MTKKEAVDVLNKIEACVQATELVIPDVGENKDMTFSSRELHIAHKLLAYVDSLVDLTLE